MPQFKGVVLLRLKPKYIGWTSKVQRKKCTFFISISKLVVLGTYIQVGSILYCYLFEDNKSRPVALIYLDGKPLFPTSTFAKESNAFILKDGSKNSHPSFK